MLSELIQTQPNLDQIAMSYQVFDIYYQLYSLLLSSVFFSLLDIRTSCQRQLLYDIFHFFIN